MGRKSSQSALEGKITEHCVCELLRIICLLATGLSLEKNTINTVNIKYIKQATEKILLLFYFYRTWRLFEECSEGSLLFQKKRNLLNRGNFFIQYTRATFWVYFGENNFFIINSINFYYRWFQLFRGMKPSLWQLNSYLVFLAIFSDA